MDLNKITTTLISPLLAGLVALALLGNPTATDTQIADEVEGDIKHTLRRKIGWAVDVLWSFGEFHTLLGEATDAAIAAARGTAKQDPTQQDPTQQTGPQEQGG